jgi:ABC-type nitrate/sulfonate/bicarbonate transport system substrate-binding protein
LTERVPAPTRLAKFLSLGGLSFGLLQLSVVACLANDVALSIYLPQRSDFGYVGITTAASENLFARDGLAVELKDAESDDAAIERTVSNPSTVGLISSTSFLKARERGLPIVAFAAGYLEMPVALYVAESSKIRIPSDFLGKKIGYGPGEDEKAIYDVMMLRSNLPRSQVSPIGIQGKVIPLSNDSLDVWPSMIGRASAILRENGVRFRTIKPSNFGVHILGTVFFTSNGTLQGSREKLTRFLRGVIDGWGLAYANVDKRTPAYEGIFKTSYSNATVKFVMEEQRPYLRPFGLRIGEFDRQQWTTTQQGLVDIQFLRRPLDISEFADFEIIKDVYRKIAP